MTLTMKDGTKVLVPAFRSCVNCLITIKFGKLIGNMTVSADMEAGIYSYNVETMATLAQRKERKRRR